MSVEPQRSPLPRSSQPTRLAAERRACAAHGVHPAHFERALLDPTEAFVARPGKAFRARMIELCASVCGGQGGVPHAALEAVELLHAGSLVIDDIQDDAAERRGEPALHRTLGTPLAINAGNWLYFVALSRLDELELEDARALALTRALHACLRRCHEGQTLDLGVAIDELPRSEASDVARTTSALKTGALLGFAARLGATLAGADAARIERMTAFGEQAGVALQMLDDLGCLFGDTRREKALEDLRGRRVTWAWAWASESLDALSYKQLVRLVREPEELPSLRTRLALAVGELGRERVRTALDAAMQGLRDGGFDATGISALARELSRLEKSYG